MCVRIVMITVVIVAKKTATRSEVQRIYKKSQS